MSRRFAYPWTLAVLAWGASLTGCGGGSPASANVQHPLVRQFSPTMSPIDFNQPELANPTFTDGMLTVSTEPAYPGKIVVFFNEGTKIDPNTVFLGGNPALGLDLTAFQVLRYVPDLGNIPLDYSQVDVLDDRIIFTPAVLPLADGQYSVGIFGNLKSVEGDAVQQSPVFHSFTVGTRDTINPIVVVTNPTNHAVGIGAGVPPPPPPSGAPSSSIADVRTTIFGPTSPDVIIRFSESITAASVTLSNIVVVNASANVPGGGAPPALAAAPSFPKLKSVLDQSSLPSNGFEVVWRADPKFGGLPFGAQIQVTVVGSDGGANASPIADRSGNPLVNSYVFQFQTIAPPKLPENPEPMFAVYFSANDRVGVIDTVNQAEIAVAFTNGTLVGPNAITILTNVVVPLSDVIATKQTLGAKFDPNEISVDLRINGATAHTFLYVQSAQSGQVVILNSRTSLPVALINTPSPGGLSNQTGFGSSNVLVATNSSANTYTVFNISAVKPGQQFLNAPITIQQVSPTGNTPKAISITATPVGDVNRDSGAAGPPLALIMYADFTDGVVNTAVLGTLKPKKQFALGTGASPNDISLTPCLAGGLLLGAISEGGLPGEGKVAYYISGPGCATGVSNNIRPDSITGDLSGFDAPAGLDMVLTATNGVAYFAMAESGSTANRVVTLGAVGILPQLVQQLPTGANPTVVTHMPPWLPPPFSFIRAAVAGDPPEMIYTKTLQVPTAIDGTGAVSQNLYVCVRGAGRVEVMNALTGARPITADPIPPQTTPNPPADRVSVPGVRNVATTNSQ